MGSKYQNKKWIAFRARLLSLMVVHVSGAADHWKPVRYCKYTISNILEIARHGTMNTNCVKPCVKLVMRRNMG